MTKKRLIIWIPLAALLVNGLVYFIVSNVRSTTDLVAPVSVGSAANPPTSPPGPPMTEERREPLKERGLQGKAESGDPRPQQPQQDEKKRREDEKTALARRAIGLAALEAGDYEKALINFTEARALLGDKAQVSDLLRVTEELRGRPGSAARRNRPTPAPAPAPVVQRTATRAAPPIRRVPVRETPPVEPTPVAEAPPSGLLIVTTTPRGLLVQVDESPIDLTPMRAKVNPGSHRVALLDGDRKLYEATFVVKEGATATVLKDLSSEIAANNKAAAPPTAPPPPPPAFAKEEAQRPPTVPAAALAEPAPAPAPRLNARPSTSRPGTGGLAISSPGLYGMVWVNGRPRGFSPVEIRDMPMGPVKVEVRVNGVEKRSSTVVVQPGVTTAVNLRSVETTP